MDARPFAITIPTLITLGRILLAPAVGWALLQSYVELAASLFIVASLSDWLDGYLARRWHQTTRLGAWLDALADKLVTLCSAVPLVVTGHLPLAVVLVLVGRDALIVAAAFSTRRSSGALDFPPSPLGKLHTALVFCLVAVLLAQAANWIQLGPWFQWLFALPVLTAILSCTHYIRSFSRSRHVTA
ncbi:MAG: CDP-alcohol phosphatidyltransferase family protein [Betaproteobacteria bacterium]|nr:CDP-alcohol phosphatidyltransferase family protein [Betaproteobacteria bacterium]